MIAFSKALVHQQPVPAVLVAASGGDDAVLQMELHGPGTAAQIEDVAERNLHRYMTNSFKAEASLGWQRQHSTTDMEDISVIDDVFTDYTAALALTRYGRGWAFYQRHSFTHGSWDNQSISRVAKPSADYNMYNFTGIYQRGAAHGQLLSLRANLQWSATRDLRPSKQFFLGGVYSVRGYQENLVGGDNGYTLSLEYSVPLRRQGNMSLYGFFDYGNLWGESSYDQHGSFSGCHG